MHDHIYILGVKWKLRIKRDLKDDDGNECHGLTDYAKKTIWIDDKTMMEDVFMETIVHETLHVFMDEMGIEIDSKVEEAIVKNAARMLVTNFKIKLR